MAKGKPGLPEGFDLNVSKEDLVEGPARLPGYLDRGARLVVAPPIEEIEEPTAEPVASTPVATHFANPQVLTEKKVDTVQPKVEATRTLEVLEKPKRPKAPVTRLQINLSSDAQIKVGELVELIRAQSPEKGVNYNDVIQALIFSLYEAKDELDVSQLPLRGRWGSPTAKSFAAALGNLFGQALAQQSERRGDPFKQAVGS